MPIWIWYLLGGGAAIAAYEVYKHPSAGSPVNAATVTGVQSNLVGKTAAQQQAAVQNLGASGSAVAAHPIMKLSFANADQNAFTVAMLKALAAAGDTNTPAYQTWLARTAENPYFSQGAPGSIALGWG